jgi:hypothetical protein
MAGAVSSLEPWRSKKIYRPRVVNFFPGPPCAGRSTLLTLCHYAIVGLATLLLDCQTSQFPEAECVYVCQQHILHSHERTTTGFYFRKTIFLGNSISPVLPENCSRWPRRGEYHSTLFTVTAPPVNR